MHIELFDPDDLKSFIEKLGYFHDSILREMSVISRGYIDSNYLLCGDSAPFDARAIFQFQSDATPCIELIFYDVIEIHLFPRPLNEYSVVIEGGNIVMKSIDEDANISRREVIKARRLKYRYMDKSCLGNKLYSAMGIPREDNK